MTSLSLIGIFIFFSKLITVITSIIIASETNRYLAASHRDSEFYTFVVLLTRCTFSSIYFSDFYNFPTFTASRVANISRKNVLLLLTIAPCLQANDVLSIACLTAVH